MVLNGFWYYGLSRRCTYIWFKKPCLRMRHYIAFMVLGSTESQCMIVCPRLEYRCCVLRLRDGSHLQRPLFHDIDRNWKLCSMCYAFVVGATSKIPILFRHGCCMLCLCAKATSRIPILLRHGSCVLCLCAGATYKISILLYQPFGGAS